VVGTENSQKLRILLEERRKRDAALADPALFPAPFSFAYSPYCQALGNSRTHLRCRRVVNMEVYAEQAPATAIGDSSLS